MRRLTATGAALLVLGAGGCGSAGTTDGGPAPTSQPAVEMRSAALPVAGMDPYLLGFASAEAGYALFSSCQPGSCRAVLYATRDGGRTWAPRALPVATGADLDAHVIDPDTVAVRLAPHGWYVSTDAGRTFTRHPDTTGPPVPVRLPVPAGTGLPGRALSATRLADGRVVVLSQQGERLHTALGRDAAWQRLDVPGTVVEGVGPTYVTHNRGDVWLAAGNRRDGTITLWRLGSGGWAPVRAALPATRPGDSLTVAAAGDGALVLAGVEPPGYLLDGGARFEPLPNPVRPQWVGALTDGTVTGGGQGHTLYLRIGHRWTVVTIRAEGLA